MKRIPGEKFLLILILFLCLFYNFRYISSHLISADSWTHLGIGKYIVENKSIPTHKDISYKKVDLSLEFISHSWLSDVILYLGTINQTVGLFFLVFPTFFLSLFLLHQILNLYRISVKLQVLSLVPVLVIGTNYWKIHPFIFMIPLLLSIILVYFLWKKGEIKTIWFLPLLTILWANMAGGFIVIPLFFLFLIILIELGHFLIINFFSRPKEGKGTRPIKSLVISFLIASFSTLINPFGIRIWIYTFTVLAIVQANRQIVSLPGALISLNQNFTRNIYSSFFPAAFLAYFILLLFLLGLTIVKEKGQFILKHYPVLPLLFFLFIPIVWVKFIPLGVFATLPIFSVLITNIIEKMGVVLRGRIVKSFYLILVFPLLYLCFFPPQGSIFHPPQKQMDMITELNLPSNHFTTFDLTGYALYSLTPQKVILDAQDDLFDENILINFYSWPLTVSEKFFNNLVGGNYINTMLVNKNIGGLANTLSQHPDWALLYFDTNGFLFVKKDAVARKILEEDELRFINLTRNLGFNPGEIASATAELEKFTAKYPQNKMALGQLASLYRFNKDFSKAENTLRKIPLNEWDYAVYTEDGRIKAAEGLCKSAEESFIKALKDRSEQNYSRTVLELAILYVGCFGDRQKAKHYFLRYNSFLITPVEREKLRQIMKNFNISLE
jgi:tetratricopeptide (TPR) repeat protein